MWRAGTTEGINGALFYFSCLIRRCFIGVADAPWSNFLFVLRRTRVGISWGVAVLAGGTSCVKLCNMRNCMCNVDLSFFPCEQKPRAIVLAWLLCGAELFPWDPERASFTFISGGRAFHSYRLRIQFGKVGPNPSRSTRHSPKAWNRAFGFLWREEHGVQRPGTLFFRGPASRANGSRRCPFRLLRRSRLGLGARTYYLHNKYVCSLLTLRHAYLYISIIGLHKGLRRGDSASPAGQKS